MKGLEEKKFEGIQTQVGSEVLSVPLLIPPDYFKRPTRREVKRKRAR